MQAKRNPDTVLFISENPDLAVWCNTLLGPDYSVLWLKAPENYILKFIPLAVLTDFGPEKFSRVYSFFAPMHIPCFCITRESVFPEFGRKIFPKARFIQMENSLILKFSIDSERQSLGMKKSLPSQIDEYYRHLQCAAESDENVLLLGNSGAGKTHDAKIIHQNSSRSDFPFVCFTMAESNINSIESDLFGVAKNAFTGVDAKDGVLRQAQGGTLFFDEITEAPMEMQSKLLTVISERRFRQKGSDLEEIFTGRFIFATNADIDALVSENRFREDLYNRINVLRLKVPELNQRGDDIAEFAMTYASEKNKTLSTGAIRRLVRHRWTGNIRQLRNVVVRACTFTSGSVVEAEDLSFD